MARRDRDAPEPLARLLARSEAVARELEHARDRLADLAERFDADEPLTDEPATEEERIARDRAAGWAVRPRTDRVRPDDPLVVLPATDDVEARGARPGADDPEGDQSHDPDIAMLQEAARRRLSDER